MQQTRPLDHTTLTRQPHKVKLDVKVCDFHF